MATVSGLLHPWRAPRDVVEAPLASKLLVAALIVGVAYYAGAWIGFTTTFPGVGTARRHIFWPPNVILLAALVVTPVRWWWHCGLTTFVAHVLAHMQLGAVPPAVMVVQFAGNFLQAAAAALALRRLNDPPWRVDSLRTMITMIVVAGIAAPAVVSALIGHIYVANGWVPDYASAWRVRFLANAVSVITLGPLFLTIAGYGIRGILSVGGRRVAEFAAVLAGLVLVSVLVAGSADSPARMPLLYAPLPLLLWAAVRLGAPGLCLALVAMLLIFLDTTFGGPSLTPVPADNTTALVVFLVAVAVPLLLLAAIVQERRHAEEHVVESQQRYQLATMAGNVSVWEWDLETDHLFVDPGLKRTLGYGEDEIPDTLAAWRAHVPPKDIALMRAAARAHLNGVTPHYDVEHRLLHRDGSVRWFHLRGAVSARRGDRAVRMSGTEVDITERRQAAEELRVARLNLAHASRLALVGELMASISHEIKQPLTSILSNASAGLRLLRVDPRTIQGVDLGEIFRDVCDDTRRAADIIERLRTLARKRPLQLVALDVNDVVNDILRVVGADARRRGVTLRAELVPSLPAVAADPVCLQQIMLNLILNAMEAMDHTATANDREVAVLTRSLDDAVEVVVRDTGPGISADRLPTIFDAFVTTKRDGLGLGLAVARSIVDSHGGRLWAEDRAGHGATFRLTLPVLGPR